MPRQAHTLVVGAINYQISYYAAVVCPVLPIPPNAMLNFDSDFEPGQQATFSCDPDYTLEGEAVLTCENGTWDHPTPLCVLGQRP